jgi:hypothetical protein
MMTTVDQKRLTWDHTNERENRLDPMKSVRHTTPRALCWRGMHHRREDRAGRTLFWLQDVAAASSFRRRRHRKRLNKEWKPSHQWEAVVRHGPLTTLATKRARIMIPQSHQSSHVLAGITKYSLFLKLGCILVLVKVKLHKLWANV